MKKLLAILPAALLLISCSNNKKIVDLNLRYIPDQAVPQENLSQYTQRSINRASQNIDNSMNILAKMKVAENPVGRFQPPENARRLHMTRRISITWNGPMLPVIEKLAKMSHYRIRILGNPPAQPILVNLKLSNYSIADVLRDVQYQTFHNAKVAVYPNTNVIEVRYLRQI